MCRSEMRALRTGPTRGGIFEENTAMIRVTPPSTCSTYTTSADRSPIWGWAACVLSIFTASTGLFSPRVPPLNGFVAGAVGDGEAVVAPGAAAGGEACCAPPEQATSAPQTRTPEGTAGRRMRNPT